MSNNRVYIFDTTLRDGQQTTGVDFSTSDKVAISKALDDLGVDYIEGGWPGSNPTDNEFFLEPPKLNCASLTAFGMTRRSGRSSGNDPGLSSLNNSSSTLSISFFLLIAISLISLGSFLYYERNNPDGLVDLSLFKTNFREFKGFIYTVLVFPSTL